METLAKLMADAEKQEDSMTNPRMFLAIFSSGAHNGYFLDPYMGVIKLKDINGVVYAHDLDMHSIPAIWVD